ncbi:MAG: hypothetical protein MRY59_10955 [Aquisalinus sp.]|nr:hypothetical protein [Aquisalinus sp.]
MSKLEKSVQELAIALEELSVRVEKNILTSADRDESLTTAQGQAQVIQQHAGKAARDLASAINDLKEIIATRQASQKD